MKTDEHVHARVQQLRVNGAARLDPARMAQLEVLVRRLSDQPDAVRALLRTRIELAVQALEEQIAQAPPQRPRKTEASVRMPLLPRSRDSSEMASVTRFRRTWANGHAQERVGAAMERGPRNAGPLNSHMLVLQTLNLMRALPGDYLRRFLTHVETLQWLETTQAQGSPAARPKRRKPR